MPNTLHDYARMGATARLTEIEAEVASIRAAFPKIGGAAPSRRKLGRTKAAPPPQEEAQAPPAEQASPKRRKMSAKARKAIGDAQRKRWAKQKANG